MAQNTTKPPSFISSLLQTVSNHLKPHRAEALQRIRVNAFCFLLVIIFTNLLPLPTLQGALRVVLSSNRPERWAADWPYRWFCIAEAVYAVKYPRAPLPPTPARPKTLFDDAPGKRAFKILSPNSSPQPQKAFSMSQSASFSTTASPSRYATSPLSTPSRVIHYPSVLPGASTNTQASSTSSMPFHATPSPVVSAYRGKHSSSVGRALDESFLGRMPPLELDDE
ncbi:hypothetical protein D9615_006650 [Tricholomella constricta]|uniref:Uncharacterized protein n=1 Tax=Tricholomella constricta TaxID=117010 RepID=A0A8H5M3L9_9AGAR|nr:hypothetical protein D9615_006650 [Tricholomella constricta]